MSATVAILDTRKNWDKMLASALPHPSNQKSWLYLPNSWMYFGQNCPAHFFCRSGQSPSQERISTCRGCHVYTWSERGETESCIAEKKGESVNAHRVQSGQCVLEN